MNRYMSNKQSKWMFILTLVLIVIGVPLTLLFLYAVVRAIADGTKGSAGEKLPFRERLQLRMAFPLAASEILAKGRWQPATPPSSSPPDDGSAADDGTIPSDPAAASAPGSQSPSDGTQEVA